MATVTKKQLFKSPLIGGVPFGNLSSPEYSFVTNASGVYVDGDASAAVGVNDKVRIGYLPAGARLQGALAILSDAFTATSTFDIGFEYVDGVDSADVPQDADYFFASLAASTAARTAANNTAVRPVTLPKDAYVIITNKVAAQNVVGVLDLVIHSIFTGNP